MEEADLGIALDGIAGQARRDRDGLPATGVEVGPNGTTALVAHVSGVVYLLQRDPSWRVVASAATPRRGGLEIAGIAFAADGMTAALLTRPSEGGAGTLLVLRAGQGVASSVPVGTLTANERLEGVSPDGNTAVVGTSRVGERGRIQLIDLRAGRVITATTGFGAPIAFNEHGDQLLAIGADLDGLPWPSVIVGNGRLTRSRIYRASDGELLCEGIHFSPVGHGDLVAPDLAVVVVGSYERPLIQRTCEPHM
ncbi:major royal jelly family protein, partial [Micromonospora sp. H61]|uniref:major royal jelly family protein n=1 Tax=Micromonospora sp. H61 TaxID=2824888 RepID=UPI001FFD7092